MRHCRHRTGASVRRGQRRCQWIRYDTRRMLPLPRTVAELRFTPGTLLVATVAVVALMPSITATAPSELRVNAGKHSRTNAIVPGVVAAAGRQATDAYELRSDAGDVIPVQIDRDGAGLVRPALPCGRRRADVSSRGTIRSTAPKVTVTPSASDLAVAMAGKDILTYKAVPAVCPLPTSSPRSSAAATFIRCARRRVGS